jgi:hypothetical protein
VLGDRDDQGVLRAEVVVQHRDVDARALDDVAGPQAAEALLGDQAVGGLEQGHPLAVAGRGAVAASGRHASARGYGPPARGVKARSHGIAATRRCRA